MNILLLRLSSLRDTAASSTHRVLADLVRAALPDATVDFAFLPPHRRPQVTGVNTAQDWQAFDLVLTTNAFVQESVNLPWLLHAAGVSPWATDRPPEFPPILLGGSNVFAAQCLARPDGSAVPDGFFFGEAEAALPAFLTAWAQTTGTKRERLQRAAQDLDGFWITGEWPSIPVRQAVARVPPSPPAPIPPPDTELAGTVRLAAGSGCPAFCSFCFEGYERKPYREQPVDALIAQARALKLASGAHTLLLDAFTLNAHAELGRLVTETARLFRTISFKSQRADGLAACPAIIDLERAAGKQSFTLGVEGISARMRAFLDKSLDDTTLDAEVRALLDRRVRELKLFFIVTAHETPADLEAFQRFCAGLRARLDQPDCGTRVILSFGRLVRMPNTPLQHDRLFLAESDWRFAVDGVMAVCRRLRLECRFAFDWPDYLGTQLLAACGHDAADAVVRLACDGLSYHGPWRAEEAQMLARSLPETTVHAGPTLFPFVRRSVDPAFVLARWEDARQARDSDYCLGGSCLACGACTDAAERVAIVDRPRTAGVTEAMVAAVADIEARKRRLVPLYFLATLPDACCGHSAEWVNTRLAQILLTRHPELADTLLTVTEQLFSTRETEEKLIIPTGATVVALTTWDAPRLTRLLDQAPTLGLRPFTGKIPADPAASPRFSRASWQLRTSLAPRAAADQVGRWLKTLRLDHTLRRNGDTLRIDPAPAALRKRLVYALALSPEETGTRIDIDFSPKTDLRALLDTLPAGPTPHAFSRVLTFDPA